MTPVESLTLNFKALELPQTAIDWLLSLWHVTQVFDDFADGDSVTPESLDAALWMALVSMPCNPFFSEHRATLTPLIATSILKWRASDRVEKMGQQDARSFVWRAGFYDIVLMCFQIVKGPAVSIKLAHEVLGLYGEDFAKYLKEFNHA